MAARAGPIHSSQGTIVHSISCEESSKEMGSNLMRNIYFKPEKEKAKRKSKRLV
jgi:hypothetical protein